eukprot:Amastigsp_a515686_21.p2 type:complete len:139 gc:universal Amastigsp_a515686_21:140-556(+)
MCCARTVTTRPRSATLSSSWRTARVRSPLSAPKVLTRRWLGITRSLSRPGLRRLSLSCSSLKRSSRRRPSSARSVTQPRTARRLCASSSSRSSCPYPRMSLRSRARPQTLPPSAARLPSTSPPRSRRPWRSSTRSPLS